MFYKKINLKNIITLLVKFITLSGSITLLVDFYYIIGKYYIIGSLLHYWRKILLLTYFMVFLLIFMAAILKWLSESHWA